MNDCPFCDSELRGRTIEENKLARIFMSNPRLTKGHLLVTPKRHIQEPWEISKQELHDVFDLVHKYQKILADKFGTGCDIKQNYRPFIKQNQLKIDHVHFHLVPRSFQDEIYDKSQKFETAMFAPLSDNEMNEVMEGIS